MNVHANPVVWFDLFVQDMERAKAFYQNTFRIAFTRVPSPPELSDVELWAFPMQPSGAGCGGVLAKAPRKTPNAGGTIVYFSCTDCAVEAARALQHGGQLVRAKYPIGPNGFCAHILDTEGNIIGLHSRQ